MKIFQDDEIEWTLSKFSRGKIEKLSLSDTGWKNIEKQRGWTNRNLINSEEVQKPCTSEKKTGKFMSRVGH